MAIGGGSQAGSKITPQVARPANAVSMNPSTFVQGGLIDDVDVEILDIRFCYYDYGGKTNDGKAKLCLGIQMKDADDKVHDQYYSAGDTEFFEPSVEGVGGEGMDRKGGWLIPKGNKSAMGVNTNAGLFLASLVKEGYPVDRLEQLSITEAVVGAVLHVLRAAQPKRKGLIKTGAAAAGGQERDSDILLCSKVISLPGQAKAVLGNGNGVATSNAGSVAKPTATGTVASPAAAASNQAIPGYHDEAVVGIMEILSESDGMVTKKDLPVKAFKKFMTHPQKTALVPYLYSEGFLANCPGITFDGATVKIA